MATMVREPRTGMLYKYHKGMAITFDKVKEKRDGKIFFTFEKFGQYNPEQVVKIIEFFQKDPNKNIRYFDKKLRTMLLQAFAIDTNNMTFEKRKRAWDQSKMSEEYTSRSQIPRGKKVQLYPPLPFMKAMMMMPPRLFPRAVFYDLAKRKDARYCCMTEVWNEKETQCHRLAIFGARVAKEMIFMAKDKNYPIYQKSDTCHTFACKYHFRLMLLGAPRDPNVEWRCYEEYEDENILDTVFNHQEFDVDCLITMIASYDLRMCNSENTYFDLMLEVNRNSDLKTRQLWAFLQNQYNRRTYKRLNLLGDMTISEWMPCYIDRPDHRYDDIAPPQQNLRKDSEILILGGTGEPVLRSRRKGRVEQKDQDKANESSLEAVSASIPKEDLEVIKEFYPNLLNGLKPKKKPIPPSVTMISQNTLMAACLACKEHKANPDMEHYYPPLNAEHHAPQNRRRFGYNSFKESVANHVLERVVAMISRDFVSIRKILEQKPGQTMEVTHLIDQKLKRMYIYLLGVATEDPNSDHMFSVHASKGHGALNLAAVFKLSGEKDFRNVVVSFPWSSIGIRDCKCIKYRRALTEPTPPETVEVEEANVRESLDSLTLDEAKLFYDHGHVRGESPKPVGDLEPGGENQQEVTSEVITFDEPVGERPEEEDDDEIQYLGEQPYHYPTPPPRPVAVAPCDPDEDREVDILGSDDEYDSHIMEERRREEERAYQEALVLGQIFEEGHESVEPARPLEKKSDSKEDEEKESKEVKEKQRAEREFDMLQGAIMNDRKRRFEERMEDKERGEKAVLERDTMLFSKGERDLMKRFDYRLKSLSSVNSLEDLKRRNEVLEGMYGMPITDRPELNTVNIDYDTLTPKQAKRLRKQYNLPHCSKRAPREQLLKDIPETLNEQELDAADTLAAMIVKRNKKNNKDPTPEPPPEPPAAPLRPPPRKIRIITPKPPASPQNSSTSTSTPQRSRKKQPRKPHKKRRPLRNPFCY